MEYTKEQRAIIHAQLVAAKPHLIRASNVILVEQATYICHAICLGQGSRLASNHLAKDVVIARIYPYDTITAWRREVHHIDSTDYNDNQEFRLAFLNDLIEEFSK